MGGQNHRGAWRACAGLALTSAASGVVAQERATAPASAAEATAADEIVVTARRRDETSVSAPIVLSAVGGAELRTRAIVGLSDIARIVPQLVVGNSQSVQGGSITLRGIGGSEANPLADQAVSFSIDGVQIARSTVQRMAQMDLDQVVVFKGPQALFFGKNSPAGVIDIRTADPTSSFEARASAGYEFVGNEVRGDGYVSGPLTDSLGARVALYASHLEGYARNVTAAPTPLTAPSRLRVPHDREVAGRITLKYDPGGPFDARLKVSHNDLKTEGPAENQQLYNCPLGSSQLGGGTLDCRVDRSVVRSDLGPNFARIDPRYGDGVPYLDQNQTLGSLEMAYRISDVLRLDATSGYYRSFTRYRDTLNGATNQAQILANYQSLKDEELSQELRLASDFGGIVDFVVGAYYQHVELDDIFIAASNATAPTTLFNNGADLKTDAWSVFGQISIKPVDKVEITGGGRYSYERKRFQGSLAGVEVAPAVGRRSFDDFSPEVTLTWRPDPRYNLFGSYKRGFLSGGFNAGAIDVRSDQSYKPQTIRGGEIGAKAALLDNRLRVNLAAYQYVLRGLQVQTQVGITQVVTNAGKATVKGIEGDFSWSAPIEGLRVNGALAYNHARYDVYSATCYAGQTIALGCSLNPSAAGVFRAQNLAGRPLVRAPDWILNGGLDYQFTLGSLSVGFNGNASFSDSYFANPSDQPASRQRSYWLVDAGARIGGDDEAWQLALIGRNLSNKRYITRANDVTFTGRGTGTASGVLADVSAVPSRGREIMLRLTLETGRR